MKVKTILDGQQAVVFNYLGEGRLLKGPKRVFLFRERLQKLTHFTASAYQYMRIKDNDGYVTHELGPCEKYLNPLVHSSISVLPATQIDANHVVVVYKKLKDHSVERRIVSGPTVFMPQAEEWLHQFKWHGPDPKDQGRMIPEKDTFTQLSVIPSHFHISVRDVRTTDDSMLLVKLLIFYEIRDTLQMLENTQDPIADMINAVCADVIAFAGKRTLTEFLENASGLNRLQLYPQLLQRSEKVGFTIVRISYRGYNAGDRLQGLQNATIESRTEMRLMAEVQEQEQRLKDFKLQMEQDRSKLTQEMEQSKLIHSQKMETLRQSHDLQLRQLEHEASIEKTNMAAQAQRELAVERQGQGLQHCAALRGLGVDLTQHLVQAHDMAPSEEYRIVQKSAQPQPSPELFGNVQKSVCKPKCISDL